MINKLAIFVMISAPFATGDLPQDIQTVVQQGRGSVEGRAAWDRLSTAEASALPDILAAMDTKDIVVANWLRTACDRIVERETKSGKKIDADSLIRFVKDAKRAGRARRYALELVEDLKPGTSRQLNAGWLEDPEFRFEAVAQAIDDAGQLARKGASQEALAELRKAFAAARDVQQSRDAAKGLLDLGVTVSVAEHLGFLVDWYVIGPFDGMKESGFRVAYPPEKAIDLQAEYEGKTGKIRWKRYTVREAPPASRGKTHVLVDLQSAEALGQVDDAVAFAYTEINVPKAQRVEFRGAADDNLIVWVNGKREFGFEEWRNGVRHDRHRFPVQLREGKNTVLVKVCQSLPYIAPNWEFFLRIVDETEQGAAFMNALPAGK